MVFKNKTIKSISALLVISILMPVFLFSLPKKANAMGFCPPAPPGIHEVSTKDKSTAGASGTSCIIIIKEWMEYLLKEAGKALAKAALEKVTQSIVNWINSDFHGSPLFLQNPQSFFKDITKFEVKKYVDLFGYDLRRFPFGRDFALNVISSYKSSAESNAAHTLSGVLDQQQIAEFNVFENSGWNGFFIRTQYPQNNYVGSQMIMAEALSRDLVGAVQAPAEKVQSQLQQGLGFLSPQTCPSNPAYNNGRNEFQQPSFDASAVPYTCGSVGEPGAICSGSEDPIQQAECAACTDKYEEDLLAAKDEWAKTNTCPEGLVNTTPGSVVANQISTALTSHIRNKELSAALGNSFSAIFDALVNHFLQKGLNSLASSINPAPPVDNWTYDGNTLDNTNPNDQDPNKLIIPQNVSVNVGQTTSKNISGGTAPYIIETLPESFAATATATISGNILKITGVNPGQVSITIKDSSLITKRSTVRITVVSNGGLMVIPANVIISPNDQVTASISGGKEPYRVIVGPNETIATILQRDTILIVNGFAPGETSVVIGDSSVTPKTVTVGIKVLSPVAPLGNCTVNGDVIRDITEADCRALNGTWVQNASLSVDLSATPADIQAGDSSVLSWTSTNATSCLPSWTFSSTGTSGSSTVTPMRTRTFSITCSDANGNSTADSVTVNVN